MLCFDTADYGPLERFPLLWRWTQESHALFSEEELSEIRPLQQGAAKAAHEAGLRLSEKAELACPESLDVSELTANVVTEWLQKLPVTEDQVIVSWDIETAVQVNWTLFVRRWDDFCYPSSDDATTTPLTLQWLLIYYHYERFEWSKAGVLQKES